MSSTDAMYQEEEHYDDIPLTTGEYELSSEDNVQPVKSGWTWRRVAKMVAGYAVFASIATGVTSLWVLGYSHNQPAMMSIVDINGDAVFDTALIVNCVDDIDCGQDVNGFALGQCITHNDESHCICQNGRWTENLDEPCGYEQMSLTFVALISIFVGALGIDRCLLAGCSGGCPTCLGVLKGLTCGGCGIWALVDIILIMVGHLNTGVPLYWSHG